MIRAAEEFVTGMPYHDLLNYCKAVSELGSRITQAAILK